MSPMALAPGTRLGPYDVTAQIGVGGMGEVYRATDTNLKRSAAIKVLPASVTADAERLARYFLAFNLSFVIALFSAVLAF